MNIKRTSLYWLGVVVFAGIALFLTFNKHSKRQSFDYHSEIWSDKAGYYVYLPAALKFNFDPHQFPESIDHKTGNGFQLDYTNKKIYTKYTCGVALLQLPFFLIADFFAEAFNLKPAGFSTIHHWSINVAAIFYLVLGFLFLERYLNSQFNSKIIYAVLLSLFLGTNLYYYAIDETGMSHIYSFSLFSLFLYLLQKTKFLLSRNLFHLILFGITGGLILLIRPSNIIFLSSYFFLDIDNRMVILARLQRLFDPRVLLPVLSALLITITPQLIYWQYAHGSPVFYSYGDEGFYWTNPKILQTWFSPNNGLFLYTPFYFIVIAAFFYMIKNRVQNGLFILFVFLSLSYLLASWWMWYFGCSFGARNYVEYLAILSIPLAHLYKKVSSTNSLTFIGFTVIILSFIAFNIKMTYSYDGCFYGTQDWDWNGYLELILSPLK